MAPLTFFRSFEESFRQSFEHIDFESLEDFRKHYTVSEDVIYLNHGSIGTIPKVVQDAHAELLSACESNPWFFMWSGEWEEPREEVRKKAAEFINAKPEQIALTHNTTEVFNVMAMGLPLGAGDEVLFTNLNHAGASLPFEIHAERKGYSVRTKMLDFAETARMSKEELVQAHLSEVSEQTRLLVLPHMDNMIGIRTPVKEISGRAREMGVEWIAVDTAQTLGMMPLDIAEMNVDVMGSSTHKWLQTPKGVSFAYIDESMFEVMDPMWVSWGQNRWTGTARVYEDYGTRNLPEVVCMNACFDFHNQVDGDEREKYLKSLWEYAMQLADDHPETEWRSSRDWELGGSLFAIGFNNEKASEFANRAFRDQGIVVRPFDAPFLNSIRVSPNLMNRKEDLEILFEEI